MAESFSAALKRYIAGGYKAPDAMRAVGHDVKVGRVARPARRRAMRSSARAAPPTPHAALGPVRPYKGMRGMWISGPQRTEPIGMRAAKRLVGAARLPRVGYCVRIPGGRELCHDARGYYLVGSARNPLTRAETGQALLAVRDSARAARRIPSATAPERQDPRARAAHRGWWFGQADAWGQVVRKFGTLRTGRGRAMRGRRIYYGPRAAL